jgi:co-chaperonin GroES (HSP10)
MFQPLHGLVTIVLDPKDNKTPGGLVMPDNYEGVFLTGTVRAVGCGRRLESGYRDTLPLQVGHRVLIAQHRNPQNGRTMPYPTLIDDGVSCIICDHTEVLGVMEQTTN